MRRIRAIHPSAALFVGILLAFTLPFGYSAQACGPSTKEYYGAELLVGHVEPDGPGFEDKEYATGVAHRGLVLGWLIFAAAVLGLHTAVRREGRLWATWCAVAAALSLVFAFFVIDAGAPRAGWFIAFFLPAGGVVLKILLALGRWIAKRFAPSVTTPEEPAVR
jgi:hypothetical protein